MKVILVLKLLILDPIYINFNTTSKEVPFLFLLVSHSPILKTTCNSSNRYPGSSSLLAHHPRVPPSNFIYTLSFSTTSYFATVADCSLRDDTHSSSTADFSSTANDFFTVSIMTNPSTLVTKQ